MAGYPGWTWTVSLARVAGVEPSVLETELTPGDGALLSPDWVPWSERLADYKEVQAELAAQAGEDAGDVGDDDEDDEDDEDDDFDDGEESSLHGGDLDGVDIDALDEAGPGDAEQAGSDLAAVGHDEAEEPEGQSDDAGPQPPVKPRRKQRPKKQQQSDEGE
jgi:hypothetical protein